MNYDDVMAEPEHWKGDGQHIPAPASLVVRLAVTLSVGVAVVALTLRYIL